MPEDTTHSIEEERTEIIYGGENIINRALQAISTQKFTEDVCTDANGLSAFIPIEPMRNACYDLKKRGVRMRWITEITSENIQYCMEAMKIAELRYLDGIRGNFAVHDGREYTASGSLHARRLIYSNVSEIVEQQQYFFETLWNKEIPADQKIKEIEEGIIPDFIETILDPVRIQSLQSKLINSAEKEILIIFPTVNIFHQQEGAGLIVSLQNLLKRKET